MDLLEAFPALKPQPVALNDQYQKAFTYGGPMQASNVMQSMLPPAQSIRGAHEAVLAPPATAIQFAPGQYVARPAGVVGGVKVEGKKSSQEQKEEDRPTSVLEDDEEEGFMSPFRFLKSYFSDKVGGKEGSREETERFWFYFVIGILALLALSCIVEKKRRSG